MKLNVGTRALLDCEQVAFDKLMSEVPCPEFKRAGTWTKCTICGEPYVKHPYIIPHYILNVLCEGTVVKL
jgi:hypothetical protein